MRHRYTAAEDVVILDNSDMTYPELTKLLPDRSVHSIGSRARLLGRLNTAPRRTLRIVGSKPRNWFAGDEDTEAGAAVFRAGVE